MAAAFFNKYVNSGKAIAISAGTEPANQVHPVVLEIMKEEGIDLSNALPTLLTEKLAQDASLLITMGCGEKCPYVPGLRREDWPLRDPKGKSADEARVIREEIKVHVRELIKHEKLD